VRDSEGEAELIEGLCDIDGVCAGRECPIDDDSVGVLFDILRAKVLVEARAFFLLNFR